MHQRRWRWSICQWTTAGTQHAPSSFERGSLVSVIRSWGLIYHSLPVTIHLYRLLSKSSTQVVPWRHRWRSVESFKLNTPVMFAPQLRFQAPPEAQKAINPLLKKLLGQCCLRWCARLGWCFLISRSTWTRGLLIWSTCRPNPGLIWASRLLFLNPIVKFTSHQSNLM